MKIGAKTTLFNFRMRERRTELGWSQAELAERCGTHTAFISAVESLRMPNNRISSIVERLNKIAQVLEVSFDDLFPQDYLDAIQKNKLPRRRAPIIWCREISIDTLPPGEEELMLPGAEDILISSENELRENLEKALEELPNDQRDVLRDRFGFNDEDGKIKTLDEISKARHLSIERIRQIEAKGLRVLRHPYRVDKFHLREFL